MSSSRHRAGVQTLLFSLAALLPFILAAWLLLADEVSLWSGTWLVAATATPLVIGLMFMVSLNRKVQVLLRELGSQNRELQEAHLEHERLEHERSSVNRKYRQLDEQQADQNQAVIDLAEVFARVASEVKSNAEEAQVPPGATRKLTFLNTICKDLVSLVNIEVKTPELAVEDFVVDQEIKALVQELTEHKHLPENFKLLGEDTDISARTDKVFFMSAVRTALVTLSPFALKGDMTLDVISYVHADMGQVVQLKICTRGFGINDQRGSRWFTHFQLHTDPQGNYMGPGLGMMMLKRYSDHLGGKTAISPELKDQLCVTITLPLRDEMPNEEA